MHEHVCPVGGLQDVRHTRVRKWMAERLKEKFADQVSQEEPVNQPLVKSAGKMDVVARRHGETLLIDVVIATPLTTEPRERARRTREAGRSLRTAEARKLSRYGPKVLALAVEDTGRLGNGTVRLLRSLAAEEEIEDRAEACRRLVAELQHVVLGSTAVMLEIARGARPTL